MEISFLIINVMRTITIVFIYLVKLHVIKFVDNKEDEY